MAHFGQFALDQEKDILVDLDEDNGRLSYRLSTPNHHTGNLITSLAHVCGLPLTFDGNGLKQIQGTVPAYIDAYGRKVWIFRLGPTKCAAIYPDGTIERKASIPAIAKTLMSQTKNYRLPLEKTVVKSYILEDQKFRSDLHTHMNANLHPDILIAMGIVHQVRYPLYYIKKLGLKPSDSQYEEIMRERKKSEQKHADCGLEGKYLDRRIDDDTEMNFADLILNNPENAAWNLPRIRASLSVMKDGQAVFTNLEKVYLYRYVFAKGKKARKQIELDHVEDICDEDVKEAVQQMIEDHENRYSGFSLFQDKLLWTARTYRKKGIRYAEISDTGLVKPDTAPILLEQIHEAMPAIYEETGVSLRFLAALRRIPLTIVKDRIQSADYEENIRTLKAVACDPYIAGSDIVGEEINDIRDLKPVINELVKITADEPSFVIRIHAGENDGIRDNVLNSVLTIEECLKPGQPFPHMRIGHGLYTANLASAQGKRLLKKLVEHEVTLEFQITSNVRLNNLSSLDQHPLKAYLNAGTYCVQGTDGAAIYGTDSIEEQLSLEKLLNLDRNDFLKMREAEERVIAQGEKAFTEKANQLNAKNIRQFYTDRIASTTVDEMLADGPQKMPAASIFGKLQKDMPDKLPIIVMGGSFNSDQHKTRMSAQGKAVIDEMLEKLDPERAFFVIGHKLAGYEKYLLDRNKGRFEVFAYVPGTITRQEAMKLKNAHLPVRIALEPEEMGVYKSVAYEIFKRRPFVLVGLDGNSAALNMVQDARNARHKGPILLYEKCRPFKQKAATLAGYITLFTEPETVVKRIKTELN